MPKLRFHPGEVRVAPNGNKYAYISIERVKDRVALLLIHTKSIQSSHSKIVTLSSEAWNNWNLLPGENESHRITSDFREQAYQLLREPPNPLYIK